MTSAGPSRKTESRLLDSAVRDAVGNKGALSNGKNASRRTESGNKRLRSVVVADNPGALPDASGRQYPSKPRLDMGAKVPPGVAVALKAAAAAAEDVNKSKRPRGKSSGSVWDRLGRRSHDTLGLPNEGQELDEMEADNGDVEDAWEDGGVMGGDDSRSGKRRRWRDLSDRLGKVPHEKEVDFASGTDLGLGSVGGHQRMRSGESEWRDSMAGRMKELAEVGEEEHYEDTVSRSVNGFVRYGAVKDLHDRLSQRPVSELTGIEVSSGRQDGLGSGVSGAVNPVHIMQNIHINSNIRFLQPKEIGVTTNTSHGTYTLPSISGVPVEKELDPSSTSMDVNDVSDMKKRMRQVQLEMTKLRAKQVEVSREVQKVGSTTSSGSLKPRSREDVQSHSVCVMNIHFAATKDAIGTHFSNCGDVVRVTILTDGATGKPKGSAYVEFASIDSVDKALKLNDSSLLSRPLKIVRLDGAIESAVSASTPHHVGHKSPFVSMRPPGNFLRGTSVNLRRPASFPRPIPGTAHLQWKRDTSSAAKPSFNSANGRSFITPLQRVTTVRNPASSVVRDRFGVGPIRMNRSMSYVRPVPYTPRESPQAIKEQEVAN